MEDKDIQLNTAPILQRCLLPEYNRHMDKEMHPHFPQEGRPQNSQKIPIHP